MSETKSRFDEHLAIAFPTIIRCHIMGGLLSIVVVFCSTWMWSISRAANHMIEIDGQFVDQNEAESLIKNAGHWRSIHSESLTRANRVRERSNLLSSWLPQTVNWNQFSESIETLAEEASVKLLSLEMGTDTVGQRVGVLQATCQIEGSYIGICQVLDGVARRDQPIACSEIELHRLPTTDRSKPIKCRASLTFRIPFAGTGSAAHQVLVSHIDVNRGDDHE